MDESKDNAGQEHKQSTGDGQNQRSKIYILIVVGLIVGLLLMYLIVRPRGADAGPGPGSPKGTVAVSSNSVVADC